MSGLIGTAFGFAIACIFFSKPWSYWKACWDYTRLWFEVTFFQ